MSKLFHGVVLAGTALGCGGRSSEPRVQGEGTPTAPVATTDEEGVPGNPTTASGVAISPTECQNPAQFTCVDFGLFDSCSPGSLGCRTPDGNCRCDSELPSGPAACASPEQFTCEAYMYDGRAIGCRCDETAPTDPRDCETPQQFRCEPTEPRTQCECDREAPNDSSECSVAREFVCRSYDPPTGCECIATILR